MPKKVIDKTKKHTDANGRKWYLDRQIEAVGEEETVYTDVYAFDETKRIEFNEGVLLNEKKRLESEVARCQRDLVEVNSKLAAIAETKKLQAEA